MSLDVAVAMPRRHGPRSEALHLRAAREAFPIAGGIELTHRCNLACVHCYVNLPANDRGAKARELTTDELLTVIDQIADSPTLYLTLTGGEPLLRPDFCDVYRHAHQKGLILTVYTNATLITERHVELWLEHPPRALEITQYGWKRETYDRVVDAGPQYDRFQRGLERVRAAGIAVTLKAMAMRATRDEIIAIRDFARREGMPFRYDAIISPRIDGGRKPLLQRLTPDEVVALEMADEARKLAMEQYCDVGLNRPPQDGRRYQCGAGLAAFLIDPYGKMHVCTLSRRPGWDVLRHGFLDGIRTAFPVLRAEKREHMSGCGSCGTHGVCSNCTGMAELEALSPDDGNLYFCQVSDARAARTHGAARPSPNGLVKLRLRGEHG